MATPPATSMQRVGELIALIEAALFAGHAALHAGISLDVRGITVSEPRNIPFAIIEGVIALGLLLSILLPGRGALRAGRVLATQVLAAMAVLLGQVGLAFGIGTRTRSSDLMYLLLVGLSIASMLLIAWPRVPTTRSHRASRVP